MYTIHFKYRLLALLCGLFLASGASAQLTVSSSGNAAALAANLVGPGVTITGAVLNCPSGASGTFAVGANNELGFNKGILLTSGNVSKAVGPNNDTRATVNNGAAGNVTLNGLIPGYTTHDACMLEFDLEAIGKEVTFDYVWASEEYEEYYCTNYNDVFGFFVSGPNPTGGNYTDKNIAIVPGTANTAVSINNVGPSTCNGVDNHTLYRNMNGSSTLQYDGKTVVLQAKVALKPCQKYHFKLGVADAGDFILDSGVFLREGSFKSSPPEITCAAPITINNEPGKCSAKATFSPTVTADCPVTATCSPVSGSDFPVGVTTVTCTATDKLGNQGTCQFTVTVKDNEKPGYYLSGQYYHKL
ncbi:MAG: choice-of-anchor L domain-containing protein [Lewinellaceae bacterium]|nr:choice-of-anchor L domain-containing protein [Lewinellaceae bacterium]